MPDLEFLEKGLKGSNSGASWRPVYILLLVLCTSAACFSLHLLTPGGLVHSHLLVVDSLSVLLCLMHLLLFVLVQPTDGMTPQQIGVRSLIEVFLFGVPILHVAAVLFGAHVVSQFRETLSWSFLMSSLLVLPAAILLENDRGSWIRVFMQCRFTTVLEQYAYFISMATVLGAWAGAFSIPLDWNRPWQSEVKKMTLKFFFA